MDISLARVESSNLPASQKSSIRRIYEATMGKYGGSISRARIHAIEGGHAVRQTGESIVTSAALAAAHVHLPTGLDYKKVPVDGVIGALGMIAGVSLAHEGVGADLRNVGASGISIFTFRKVFQLLAEKKLQAGGMPGGLIGPAGPPVAHGETDFGEDPIIAAARAL